MSQCTKKPSNQLIEDCLKTFHCVDKFHPIRMVMISTTSCYICGKTEMTTYAMYVKNYMRLHNYGYQFCKKCECLADIFIDIYEESGNYIPNNKFNEDQLKNISFFRHPSGKNTEPYIERNAWLNINIFPILSLSDNSKYSSNNLYSNVCWGRKGDNFEYKPILLSNLIFYNRDIFGYCPNEGILNVCSTYWSKSIEKAYAVANIPMCFIGCVYRKNI